MRPAGEPRGPGCLPEMQRRAAEVVAVDRKDMEGVELHLVIVLPRVLRVEIRIAASGG